MCLLFFLEKRCNSEEILKFDFPCPPLSTNCVEDGGTNGTCECIIHGQIFNPKYTTDTDYCVNSIDVNVSSSIIGNVSSIQNKPKFETPAHELSFTGVSISLVFVSIVVGCLFVCKKLHVYQRFRNIRRTTHRSRPFYEDVMLGTNDNDDPPLI